jgi:hypothetical protein
MGRSPRTVTLAEAFRTVLRAIYPDRPALADEIQSYGWDWFPYSTNLISDEVIAVNKAFTLLDELVAREKIGLRGALGLSKPLEDIDPDDARVSKLDVFGGKLRVFHDKKVIKTYCRVHCYETDVDRATKQRSETKRSKWTNEAGFNNFVEDYKTSLDGGKPPTEKAFTEAAKAKGHRRPRSEIRRVWRNTFGPRQRGRPAKSSEK